MRSKQDRAEIACGTGFVADRTKGPSLSETANMYAAHQQPLNEYDALMRCDFDEYPTEPTHPEINLDELEADLTDKERSVLAFVVYGGMSLSKAGVELGHEFPRNGQPTPYSKTAVNELKNSALAKIRLRLETND